MADDPSIKRYIPDVHHFNESDPVGSMKRLVSDVNSIVFAINKEKVPEANVPTTIARTADVATTAAAKQNVLTAGTNITIAGDVVSVSPQGVGSGLDAGTFQGYDITAFQGALIAGTNISIAGNTISVSPQGDGSGLNADLLQGHPLEDFAAAMSGTPGFAAKFNSTGNNLLDTNIYDNGSVIGIGMYPSGDSMVTVWDSVEICSSTTSKTFAVWVSPISGLTVMAASDGMQVYSGETLVVSIDEDGRIGIWKDPSTTSFLSIDYSGLTLANGATPSTLSSGDIWIDTQAIVAGSYTPRIKA